MPIPVKPEVTPVEPRSTIPPEESKLTRVAESIESKDQVSLNGTEKKNQRGTDVTKKGVEL